MDEHVFARGDGPGLDVFGLRAFDKTKAVTRMLLGLLLCELRLMIPDDKLGNDGFHDVMIENLSGIPAWRSSYVSPGEVTSLRRQWPKAVFETLRRRAPDIDKAFRYSGPGYCGVCDIRIHSPLDAHMVACHGVGSIMALSCHRDFLRSYFLKTTGE